MFVRKNMTLGLCSLSEEHLFHYLEDSVYFSQRFMSNSKLGEGKTDMRSQDAAGFRPLNRMLL